MFERRKVKGNTIIEIHKYPIEENKETFFTHHKVMRQRGYKSNRSLDYTKDGFFYVTYEKNILAYNKNNKGGC